MMSDDQRRALHLLTVYGECSEDTLWMEGCNRPRATLDSLVRRGLARRADYNEQSGYLYELAKEPRC